ncbi:porin [Burkholderia pseudomallei]|uniref:porin n=1 Tax=Burkholderia pseudomallei TaxID=28450 RepID=UPI00016AAEC4|nr:porin [Burkholderia pseudomallei]AFR18913.1 outer membrane porin [Burkholderia pseudomallei BPC006]AIP07516.1 gram-negative porin family protein [Burkholderia pseudomallei]AIP44141.1 gram-negative porin family protein [Burkholderia pseudomallei MSHR5858]ALB11349.1 porin [Burkholderia pseudomallei]AYX04718.1 porin [Burkholderia pseudomallei]
MKKHRRLAGTTAISASLAACAGLASGHALAQSSVTLYGIMDAGIEYVNHAAPDGGGAFRMKSGNKNTSRWGLRGVEDLGGGLKAVFRLESGIDLANGAFDDGPDSIFARRATVGLKGQWGELTLGRNFTPTYDYMLPFDPMGYAQNYSWATSSTATGGRKDGLFTRSSNAVRYDGAYGGLRFGAMYGFGNVPGSMKTSSKYDFALGYESGPFAAVVTFDRQNGAADSVTPADPVNYVQGIHAGVSYDFGRLKTMAGYRNYRRTYHTAAATQLSDMYWLGGSYDFTPAFSLTGALYHQNIKGGTDADPTLVSLRAQYALSKRTVLYAAGGFAIAKHGQNISVSRDSVGYADTQLGVTVGMQQRF